MRTVLVAFVLSALGSAALACRQALLLGLDVSLSVDTWDFRLQREGLAKALDDPDVRAALLAGPGAHVEIAVFEWSGRYDQSLIVDWTSIDSDAALNQVITTVRETEQMQRTGRTAIGAALSFARAMLNDRQHCAVRTFDISGDGQNNNGTSPEFVRPGLEADDIQVNALVIEPAGGDSEAGARLTRYFQAHVISGPYAFTETIFGFDDYAAAMRRKLLRELLPAFSVGPSPPVDRVQEATAPNTPASQHALRFD